MRARNTLYYPLGLKDYLCADDVVNLEPSGRLALGRDFILQPRRWEGLVNFICNMTYSSLDQVMAGVLVITPYSFVA